LVLVRITDMANVILPDQEFADVQLATVNERDGRLDDSLGAGPNVSGVVNLCGFGQPAKVGVNPRISTSNRRISISQSGKAWHN
jgi:hypothetical protein